MDLPCLRWQEHVAQKWIGLETEQREQFISFEEIDDVFNYARALITPDDLDVLQSLSADHSVQKDADQAAKCRERGNCSFKSRDYTAAVLHYSQGVCSAPPGSEQLSLCYANRSAALFYLQQYQLSIAVPSLASRDPSEHLGGQLNSQLPEEKKGVSDGDQESWILGSAALRHLLQLRCNAQAVVTLQESGSEKSPVQANQEIRVATAIFPTLSLLNHSCCPNTSLLFSTGTSGAPLASEPSPEGVSAERSSRGVTVTVRAAKVITAGQEILHCYGPHSRRMSTSDRQRLLQEQYYFLCQCRACSLPTEPLGQDQPSGLQCGKCKGQFEKSREDAGIRYMCVRAACGHSVSSSEVSRRLQGIKDDLEKAVNLMESERPDEALRLLRRTQCQSGAILAETHPLQGELADATARAYATMGDWKNASSHLERSALATASQYGEDSIELGHQLFKLAQLHFNGGARGPALSVISKVRRLLCLHLGPQCQELQELQAMEDCLRG
ncbi:SET and MYND domain-containing protein 4 [Takifugu flavidus]|uniref:SET and MYND domain-containing protein 4 n=1 Tax=Takifugu flavidus TaxID=433684 RepID=A0A5C6P8F5_9TELE|nr:SET and MYND domain-containing protein 4 [Takifugu flavidus]